MADVEIKYNNTTIASLSDSGTEVLETNGTFLTDDITVEYTKSGGGGGGSTDVSFNASSTGNAYYVDPNGIVQSISIRPPEPGMGGKMFTESVLSKSMITALLANRYATISGVTGGTQQYNTDNGSSAVYRTIIIIQAD